MARNGGRDNAFTSADYTGYFQTIAADRLELVMSMEADRMANLVLTDEQVLPERDVILEERRSASTTIPRALLRKQMNAALYGTHPYGIPIIGWRARDGEARAATTRIAFYRKHYAPNNAILVVAGDVDRRPGARPGRTAFRRDSSRRRCRRAPGRSAAADRRRRPRRALATSA